MTATGHALVATLIVAKIHNPYIALPLAFASHFACDMIPHWDTGTHHREKTKKVLFYESGLDVLISIVSSYLLYHNILGQSDYMLLYSAVFLSQLPDWLTAPYLILNMDSPIVFWSKQTYKIQHKMNRRLDKPWGIVTQVVTVIGLYILLFKIF
ncbi:MAG: hypothetical protein ACHQT7_02120 [Candidatus Levyibacteriota bacterium]